MEDTIPEVTQAVEVDAPNGAVIVESLPVVAPPSQASNLVAHPPVDIVDNGGWVRFTINTSVITSPDIIGSVLAQVESTLNAKLAAIPV